MKLTTVLLLIYISFTSNQHIDTDFEDEQKKAIIEGDLMIGALFPIHEAPASNRLEKTTCGAIREQYGIQRVEAALRTVDQINRSPDILPNITLGIEIRDTCSNPLIALHQSLRFVQNIFASPDSNKCPINSSKVCYKDASRILGVIGPASSEEAIQVQNLLQLFHIPQIGYSTTSSAFSDKHKYPYFVRVVPSDKHQVNVMKDILKHYNWTYIFAIHSEGEYGRRGINTFELLIDQTDICIASQHVIYDHTTDSELENLVEEFHQNNKSKVVVCFCDGDDIRRLMQATKRTNNQNNLIFIGSDSWTGRHDIVKDVEDAAQGNLMISPYSPRVRDFDQYYFDINKKNDSSNPWLDEFRKFKFNCTMHKTSTKFPPCSGEESFQKDYVQDPKLSFVIKSIYALAKALHKYRNDICGRNAPVCVDFYPINGALFMDYLRNTSFKYNDELVEFDNEGDLSARYDIMNYQILDNGLHDYVTVGNWTDNILQLDADKIQLPGGIKELQSVCSKPCQPGQKKLSVDGPRNKTCCWRCEFCKSKEISDGETCQRCDKGFKSNENRTQCVEMVREYIHYDDLMGIICITLSMSGVFFTSTTMIVFYKYGNTPVVKSSTKELCYIMFVGMILAHLCTFAFIGEPTRFSCTIVRVIPSLSLNMIYSALLVKTNRISRILSMSKKRFPTLRPKFMSTISQVSICALLISIELIICIVSIIAYRVDVELNLWKIKHDDKSLEKASLGCSTSEMSQELVLQFILNFVLLMLCTLYAFKTRKLPDNFNETKCIGFACYATAITWLAFVSVYFGSPLKVFSQCISLSISALIILIFLFFPKLYIILCEPEKNTRANFKTSKTLRCHIGTSYLLENREQFTSMVTNEGSSSSMSNVTDVDQMNRKILEYYSNLIKSNLNYQIISKSCQTSIEYLYSQVPTVDEETTTTSVPQKRVKTLETSV